MAALAAQAESARSNLAEQARDVRARAGTERQQTSVEVTRKARATDVSLVAALASAQSKATQARAVYVQLLALAQLGRANQLPAGNATGAAVQDGSYLFRISGTS